jgi:hypothetical protein
MPFWSENELIANCTLAFGKEDTIGYTERQTEGLHGILLGPFTLLFGSSSNGQECLVEIEFTLKNYRCFSDQHPARVRLREGLTSFIGINNSGKSSLLKFFYEFRKLFDNLQPYNNNLLSGLKGHNQSLSFPQEILDVEEVFCNTNERPMEIGF